VNIGDASPALTAIGGGLRWFLTLLILLGAVPTVASVVQYLLVIGHRWRDHYDHVDSTLLPRVAVLVPAWNEVAVLRFSVDRMMTLDYPPHLLRLVVVDDASNDGTAQLLAEKVAAYPGRVMALHRANGGQGKAHTLNHGLDVLLADGWVDAVLITDADVIFESTAIRRMARHLADPDVGAVTAFIREASQPPSWLNRYIGYEYCTAQAAGRRAQNVVGAQACLAGGAQLLTRANLDTLGGHIDTTTLAEDTVTTFLTQLNGRRVIFDGNAECYAEEPADIHGLWKQRLRWSRGNVQVSRRFKTVFWRPSRVHNLGRPWFSAMWYSTLLLPLFMVVSSVALVALWWLHADNARVVFHALWIINALGYIFTTSFTLLIDAPIARRSWRQAILFPGLISLTIMACVLAPRPMYALGRTACHLIDIGWTADLRNALLLFAYGWVSICMAAAWLVYRLDRTRRASWLVHLLMIVVGYGPLLCAITFAAYVAEARGTATTWDKTIKTGKVAAP
jgi:cellulose synthase/poly-beta-1,6-N-acetylglucosamine synthase-like glycosyltransferase